MHFRSLGSSDLEVSVIGLGAINFAHPQRITDFAESAAVIHRCLEAGINFIDTADAYGHGESEVHVGHALRGRRDQAIIATKFKLSDFRDGDPWPGATVRERIIKSVDRSLTKLETDYVDLYQLHHPEPGISHDEILEPLNDLVTAGKVRYIGECNYSAWRHAQSNAVSEQRDWPRMVSVQGYYNLLRRHVELEVLPYCTANEVGFIPYRPLADGWLSGKYAWGDSTNEVGRPRLAPLQGDENKRSVLEALTLFANERGHSMLELTFAWLLAHPAVSSVIAGVSNPEQVAANAACAEWAMTMQERDAVDAIVAWDGTGQEVEEPGGHSMKPRR
jgi:aryl-alcohol dehydrogenase-like predicted oxidoreductase